MSDWSEPETIDIETVDLEFKTNYLSYIALTKELIPFLKSKSRDTALIYISSGLALVPLPPRSNYCATKAALHQWIMSLRTSLQPTKIKVIEIYPPAVQTELHDEKHQPDIKNGRQMGMPLEDFTAEVRRGQLLSSYKLMAAGMGRTCERTGGYTRWHHQEHL